VVNVQIVVVRVAPAEGVLFSVVKYAVSVQKKRWLLITKIPVLCVSSLQSVAR
jgi:hypothetical protein